MYRILVLIVKHTMENFIANYFRIADFPNLKKLILKSLMHNVLKWPNLFLKSCDVTTVRYLKYVWPFFKIMHEMVKKNFRSGQSRSLFTIDLYSHLLLLKLAIDVRHLKNCCAKSKVLVVEEYCKLH